MDQNLKSKKVLAYSGAGILTGLLLIGNTYFYVGNNELKEENQKHIYKVNSLTVSNSSLEKNLTSRTEELSKVKAEKSSIEALLASANTSLEESRAKVAVLVKENNALKYLKKEVADLKSQKNNFLAQIDELQKRVMALSSNVTILDSENQRLKKRIEELQDKNGTLEKKVALGAIIRAENIIGEGQKEVRGQKFVKVLRAKKSDRIAVHFDLADNKIAEKGAKTVYLRIVDPKGKLVYNETNNSGAFLNMDNNKTMDYTAKESVQYNNSKQKVSIFYTPKNVDLAKGEYKVEVYTDGYLSGVSKFSLR